MTNLVPTPDIPTPRARAGRRSWLAALGAFAAWWPP